MNVEGAKSTASHRVGYNWLGVVRRRRVCGFPHLPKRVGL